MAKPVAASGASIDDDDDDDYGDSVDRMDAIAEEAEFKFGRPFQCLFAADRAAK